jgi:ketosteroid isomerase-like protein
MGEAANVAVVRELLDAVSREGNWVAGLAFADPEIEFETDPGHPLAGVYQGIEQVRAFLEEFEEPYERTTVEPEGVYARGEHVVTLVNVHRRPYGSSVDIESRIGFWWTLRDGRVVREQAFRERERAIEAAGLTEADAVA